ncbi:MAG: 6-bladed beta-propeller [Candidatus Magnetomorum sp.]|nr:6-bladed beta-propeller [Candidatus Magnetomorum sp.]
MMGTQLNWKRFMGILLIILCLGVLMANAEIPKTIHFQGILTDSDSKAVNGLYDMEFSLWLTDNSDGSPAWTEIHENIILHAGVYSVYLGANSAPPIYQQVDFSKPYYIGIRIRVQGETDWSDYMKNDEGRFQPLVSVPVAFYAYHTQSINDNSISTDKLIDGSVTGDKLADQAVISSKIADSAIITEKISNAAVTENKLSDSVQQQLSIISDHTQSILANAQNITTIQQNFNESLAAKADQSDLDQKANIENVYDRSTINSQLTQKADIIALSLKADLSALELKADKDNVYTRSQLYTQQQVDDLLSQKADEGEYYNQQTIDSKLSEKADSTDLNLKADQTALDTKADISQVYTRDQLLTKTQTEDLLLTKVDQSNVYDRSTVDNKLAEKASQSDLLLKADKSELALKADQTVLDLKADKDQVYTRGQLMTRTEIEELTKEKAATSSVYDREIIDQKLSEKADTSQLSLKADTTTLDTKADKDQVYTRAQLLTRTEIEIITSQKAETTSVYDRETIDQKLSQKANQSELSLKADASVLNLKADKDQVYTRGQLMTRTEIESFTKEKADTSLVYDRDTIDHKLSEKADYSQVTLKADKTALDLKADRAQVYTRGQLFTKTEIEEITSKKAETNSVYDRETIDQKFSEKADQSDLSLKADISALDIKADKDQVYTRGQLFTRIEIEEITDKKAETGSVYDRSTIDQKLSEKADQSQLSLKADNFTLDLKADKDQIYTRGQLMTRTEIEEIALKKAETSLVYDRATIDQKISEKADLTQLSLKADITIVELKADKDQIYTRTMIDQKFAEKVDQSQLSLKADTTTLELKADKDQVYTRDQLFTQTEIMTITDQKADISSVYNTTTIDSKLLEKADQSQLDLKADTTALDLKADKDQVYTRGQLFTQTEIMTITDQKADNFSVYTRTTIDSKLLEKADQSQLDLKADTTALDLKADKDQVYTRGQLMTRTEIETLTNEKIDQSLVYDKTTIDTKLSEKADSNTLGEFASKTDVLKKDGSTQLNSNWDAGNFQISARQFQSNVSSGTSPLIVQSTTKVDNLNAEFLNGKSAPSSGELVGTTTSQTLTNKTLTSPVINTPNLTGGTINNTSIGADTPSTGKFSTMTVTGQTTLNGVTNNGNLKTDSITLNNVSISAPSGDIVGTTDTQTLTNKTLSNSTISGGSINSATIGESTPGTGKFTSITTNNLTVNGTAVDSSKMTYLSNVNSDIQSQLNNKANDLDVIKRDGTRTLAGNWDAGDYQITSKQFTSDVSTGTSPLIVSSTTKVSNLNADMLDDKHAPTGDIVGTTDTQTLSNKTLTSPIINNFTVKGEAPLVFEGETDNDYELTINVVDPTDDHTITFPDKSGTVFVTDNGQISSDLIANNAITSEKIVTGSITASHIANETITGNQLSSGSVTSVQISDSAITENKIGTGSVTETKIADNAISNNKIKDNAITETKIADNTISHNKIKDNTITETKIIDGAVTSGKIADNAITTTKINNSAIISEKIASDAITSEKILDGTIQSHDLASGSIDLTRLSNAIITATKIAASDDMPLTNGTDGQRLVSNGDGTFRWDKAFDGSLIDLIVTGNSTMVTTSVNHLTVNNHFNIENTLINSVASQPRIITFADSSGIVVVSTDGKISSTELNDNAVTSDKIADSTITAEKIADEVISYTQIADNAITTIKIANNSVTSDKIEDNAVTSDKIADATISYTQLANNAIIAPKLAGSNNAALTNGNLGQILSSNGDGKFSWTNLSIDSVIPDASITDEKLNLINIRSRTANISESVTANSVMISNTLTINNSTLTSMATQNRNITFPDASGIVIVSNDGKVSSTELNDNAVTSEKIADAAISYTQLADNAITTIKIFDHAVTSDKIADDAISYTQMADNAITTINIADNAVTSDKIADNTISYTQMADNAIIAPKLAGSNNSALTNGNSGQILSANGDGTFLWTNISVDNTIPDSSITDEKLNLTNITANTATLAQSVTANNLMISSTIQIGETTLNSMATQARTITFADNSGIVVISSDGKISTSELNNNAVTSEKIANSTINYTQIADNAITSNKIADNAVNYSKIAGSSNQYQVLVSDNSGNSSWQYIKNEMNEFTVAGGASVSIGDIVEFGDNVISKGIGSFSTIPTVGTKSMFNTGTIDHTCGAKINDTTFVSVFRDCTTETGRAIIGQLNGTTISWGNQYTFSATDVDNVAVCPAGENTFVVMYEDKALTREGMAVVGTVNGNVITFGTKILSNAGNTYSIELSQLDGNKIAAQYRDDGNSGYESVLVGEVNGYSIAWGTNDYPVSDAKYVAANSLNALSPSKIISIYNYGGGGIASIGEISGTAVSFGDEYTFQVGSIIYPSVGIIDDSTFVLAYRENFSPFSGVMVVGQVSGTTISFGTPYTFAQSKAFSLEGLPDGRFVLSYADSDARKGVYIVGTVDGLNLNLGDPVNFDTSDPYTSSTFWMTNNSLATVCSIIGYGVAASFEPTWPLGIATTAGNAGELVKVTLSGVVDGLSGLSTGAQYYADNNGNITTTPTERYLGYAVSATELYLQTDSPGAIQSVPGYIQASDLAAADSNSLSNGESGQSLVSNGDGTFSWTEISGSGEISDGSITTEKIADSAITYTKIAAGSIAAELLAGFNKTSLNNGTSGQSLSSNGDGSFSWIESTPFSNISTAGGAVCSYSIGLDNADTGTGPGEFDYPYFLTMDNSGTLYVSDTYNHRIQIFTTEGQYIRSFGSSGTDAGEFDEPHGIVVDDSKIYVVDSGNHRVQIFNAVSETFEYSIGTGASGNNSGQFNSPKGIAVDNNGKIYVADANNHRVQVFSNSGAYEYSIGTGIAGSNPGEFNRPYDVYVDNSGKIYVTDQNNSRVQIFSNSGNFENTFGSSGQGAGEFGSPVGITIDSTSKIYVSDYDHRIQVFSSSYAYEYSIGTLSSSLDTGKFEEPAGMFVNDTGKLFVADSYNQRIQVFQVPVTGYYIEIGNIGLGTSSPTETLEVVGSIKFVDGNQSDGKLFISNSDGKGSWQTIDAIPDNSIQITKIAGSNNEYQVLVSDSSGNSTWQYIKNEMNEFTVASGASISIGDIVEFGDNVISKGIGSYSTTPTVGTKSTFNTGTTDHTCGAKINDTTFVSVFRDRTTETGRAIIGQLNGTTISWGNQYTFSATDVDNVAVCPAGENTFVVMYEDKALTREGMAVVGTVNGNVITFGTKILSNAGNTYSIELSQLDGNKIAAQYRDDGNSGYESVLVGEVNGYSIAWGTNDYPVSDAKYVAANSLNALSPSKIISIYNYGGGGIASIGEISGTAVSFGDEYTFQVGSIIYPSVGIIDDSTFVLAYRENFSPFSGVMVVGQVSGTTISFGTPYTFAQSKAFSLEGLPDGRFVLSYADSDARKGVYIVGTVDGLNLNLGDPVNFDTSDPYTSSTFWMTNNSLATVCSTIGYGIAASFEPTWPLGIATTGGAAGELVKVTISGVVDGLSGLSTGSQYYADSNGNITTTPTDRYLGYALSSTELYLQTNTPGAIQSVPGLIQASDMANAESTSLSNGEIGQLLSSNGDGTFSWAEAFTVTDGSITSAKIADGTITGSDIAAKTIDNTQIADGGIVASSLAAPGGGSLTNGYSGKSLLSNGDGTFSWNYSSPLVHSDSPKNSYIASIRHEPYYELGSPNFLATDSDGNIVVSNSGKKIQTFSPEGKFISEFGDGYGTGDYLFKTIMGVAWDSNGKMYVVDQSNYRVMVYTSAGTFDFQIGSYGTGNGEFFTPSDVAINSAGKIYVVDTNNHRIQIFSSTGVYESQIGSGVSSTNDGEFNSPSSIEIDSDGKIYIADMKNNRIQVFSSSNVFEYSFGTNGSGDGQFNYIYQIAFDSTGKIFATDYNNNRVQVFTKSGTFLYAFGSKTLYPYGTLGYMSRPKGITIDNDDNVYVTETGVVQKFSNDGTSIYRIAQISYQPGAVNDPIDVDVDEDGNIYVIENGGNRLSVFTSSREFAYSIGTGDNSSDISGFNYPMDIDVSNGKIYVADSNNTRIQVFNSASGAYEYSIGGNWGNGPYAFDWISGIGVDDNTGKLYVSDSGNNIIKVYSSSGVFEYTIGTGNNDDAPGDLNEPQCITIDDDGNIYVPEGENHRISVFTSDGTFQYSVTHDFGYPREVAIDRNGNYYVIEQWNDRFQVFSSDWTFLYMFGGTGDDTGYIENNEQFRDAYGIAVDKNGTIYVADMDNQRIQILSGVNTYYVTDGRIGIGTDNPKKELEVVGSVKIVDGSQGSGKVFVSDESGVGTWNYVNNVVKTLPVNPSASSDVSTGDIVQYFNGYVEKGVGGYTSEISIIAENYSDETTQMIHSARMNSETIVVTWQCLETTSGHAIVGQIIDTSMSWGQMVTFTSSDVLYPHVSKVSDNSFIIVYTDKDNTNKGTAIIGQISGTDITFGTPSVFNDATTNYPKATRLSDTKIVVTYRDENDSGNQQTIVADINGYSLTWGAESTLDTQNAGMSAIESMSGSKFIVSYSDPQNNTLATAVVGEVNGTSISLGNEYTLNYQSSNHQMAKLSDDRFILIYRNDFYNDEGKAVVGEISGTAITFGSPVNFSDLNTTRMSFSLFDDNKIFVNYQTSEFPALVLKKGIITGNSIAFELVTPSTYGVFENAEISLLTLNDNKWILVAGIEAGAILMYQKPTYAIGIAASNGSRSNRESVNVVYSGIVSGLRGLIEGKLYYADEAGNLTTTVTDRYLGYALSDTELYLKTTNPGSKTIDDGLITATKLASSDNEPLSNGSAGQIMSSNGDGTFSWADILKLPAQSTEPATCNSSTAGSVAATSAYRLCICNGTAWNDLVSGAACSW